MIKRITWFVVGFTVFVLLLGNSLQVHAQIVKSSSEKFPAQSLASDPNSKPTQEKIEKGRALLAKILNVLTTIPLMDADAVMAAFGIGDVDYEVYPTHIRVTPKDLVGTLRPLGLTRLSIRPWESDGRLANLSGLLDGAACIQKRDIDMAFGYPYKSEPVVLIDRVPPERDFYPTYFSYMIEKNATPNYFVELKVSFYSKYCAESFGAGYFGKLERIK